MKFKTGQRNFRFHGNYYSIDMETESGEEVTLTIEATNEGINFEVGNIEGSIEESDIE